jgi:hypothetical protein
MGTQGQQLYSTPAFELFRRGRTDNVVKVFRGMNNFQAVTEIGPEWAQSCSNVIVPGWGGISKFRLPVIASVANISGNGNGPNFFIDFQQANGTRQVVCTFNANNSIWLLTNDMAVKTLIEVAGADTPIWSMVEASNRLFAANNVIMKQWTGIHWWNWGIVAPTVPVLTSWLAGVVLTRAANVVTMTLQVPTTNLYFNVGDTIQVLSCPGDPTFVGTFVITVEVAPGASYQWAQAAANSGPFNGTLTAVSASGNVRGVTATRVANVATYTLPGTGIYFGSNLQQAGFVGTTQNISGFANATFNGNFTVLSATFAVTSVVYVTSFTVSQFGPDGVAAGTGVLNTGITITTSRTYAMSYFNTATGDMSNIGPTLTIPGPLTNRVLFISGTASADPQVDGIGYFSTLDGGGDLFLNAIMTGSFATGLIDFKSDANLNTTVQGPLINNPPPVGSFLAVGQSRIFIAKLLGATTDIAYTGYEQIVIGRPETSVPLNNRLRLAIGASSIAGIGVLHHGVVAFSNLDRMYTLRGQVEDVTINVPVQFSAYLEEMPWKIGCKSHATIQSTPYGLVWWASDNTVQMFDFGSGMSDISAAIIPLLRQATPGFEFRAQSAYFNWLERDWYALLYPANASQTPNQIIFWALNKSTQEVDIFPVTIPADSIGVLTLSTLAKLLCIGVTDAIYKVLTGQDTTGGTVPAVNTTEPPTAGNLAAFWLSGYYGNDSPYRSKMFRRCRLITSNSNKFGGGQPQITTTFDLVDDLQYTVNAPLSIGPVTPTVSSLYPLNWRGNRAAVQINFDSADCSQNVLEMDMGMIATSDR